MVRVFEVPCLSLVLESCSADRLSWLSLGFADECCKPSFILRLFITRFYQTVIRVVQVDDVQTLYLKRRR